MRVMSTFSGISAASVAWKPLGWEFVAYSEPSAFPCHVLNVRCDATAPKYLPEGKDFDRKKYKHIVGGTIPNYGDITQITDEDLKALGPVDILEGGSPCQSFSVAGARAGLQDARGNLALAFVNLVNRMKKYNGLRFVVYENVPGILSHVDNPFGCLLGALAGDEEPLLSAGGKWPNAGNIASTDVNASWRVLDAQYFGVPQRRKRVFLVASLRNELDTGEVAFIEKGEGWLAHANKAKRQEAVAAGSGDTGSLIANILTDSSVTTTEDPKKSYALTVQQGHDPQIVIHSIINSGKFNGGGPMVSDSGTMFTLVAGHVHGVIHPETVGTLMASGAGTERVASAGNELDYVIIHPTETVGTLMTHSGASKHIDVEHLVIHDDIEKRMTPQYIVRRLMPLETERLQGFPDNWTDVPFEGKPVSDLHRYRACGNSMATVCMAYVGWQLQETLKGTAA